MATFITKLQPILKVSRVNFPVKDFFIFWKRLKGLLIRPLTNENKTLSSIETNFWFILSVHVYVCMDIPSMICRQIVPYLLKAFQIIISCSKNT